MSTSIGRALALIAISAGAVIPVRSAENAPDSEPALFGGCGGIYLLAEPGPLAIDLFKRERNLRGTPSELRAILFGPDRAVLAETNIQIGRASSRERVYHPV